MKEHIIRYLIDTYNPQAIITYGSYANGTANEHSDFDALIIANHSLTHDESVIEGVTLDVFIYAADTFAREYKPEDFIQIYDGKIELDPCGLAENLKKRVVDAIDNKAFKSQQEIRQEIEWCKKMLLRCRRGDAEGYFRWHWLLIDSLEIYYDIVRKPYFGPKKALKQMAQNDGKAYDIFEDALKVFDYETLKDWIKYLDYLQS